MPTAKNSVKSPLKMMLRPSFWIDTPLDIAKQRALDPNTIRNGYTRSMTETQFNDIVSKLEPPRDNEKFIKIDGTKLDPERFKHILSL